MALPFSRTPWPVRRGWGAGTGAGRIAPCRGHDCWDRDAGYVAMVAPHPHVQHPSAEMPQLPREQPVTAGSP